jgi:magnesium transporter
VNASALHVVELDFPTKTLRPIEVGDIAGSIESGRHVWIDIEAPDASALKESITALGLVREPVIEHIASGDAATQLARYENYLHVAVCGCRLQPNGELSLERLDAVVSERFLVTAHVGPRQFLDAVKREYAGDFVRYAKTPSFLVFELWDHLVDHYVDVQKRLEAQVEKLQSELFREIDDTVFQRVAEIGADLLRFRSVLVPTRAMLTELSTRRSIFISEATQGFLQNLVGTIERVLQDVLADRDSLNQALNLYMSMVSHRTNRAMNKLTVISVIFLPLTFLCGVYGMNFRVLPELEWRFGYGMFWGVVAMIAIAMLMVMRRARLL